MQAVILSSARWVQEISLVGNASFSHLPAMQTWITSFESKYKQTFQNRRLKWITEFGRAVVRFSPRSDQRIDILCSTAQAMFLLLFEKPTEVLTWKEIKGRLNLESDGASNSHYLRHFMGLAVHEEARFLIIGDEKRKVVQDEDEIRVNLAFTSPKRKIAAKVVSVKTKGIRNSHESLSERLVDAVGSMEQESPDAGVSIGQSGLPVSVEQNRNTVVDAAIVRIMKSRKKLNHLELISSLNEGLKSQFLPPSSLVKERVSYLIDREFLQRDANQHDTYHYIA
eukprot:Protomagalhaensia_wolfi_Nauph_80__1813@NODE_2130_length_1204_cov_8_266094_g1666_i0_p1_GENE_NODE_2130_length_1204_cov_8_266094_g1666_i0NODE_2130_length_1204_cov_8_266094_g1666_i0_p1_ORF_typecomplete_len282_score40_62Cullin_Nedd8/PF10557_9/1e19Cullin/PF00888_22/1_9e16_NODE_2130_length_1204_cov_8_266094_g1666_i03131158